MEKRYRSRRIIGWVIVDGNFNIINKSPTKDELKGLEEEPYKFKVENRKKRYTDKELLNYPKQFYEEYGMVPTQEDFDNIPEYPVSNTYTKRFGSFQKALKLVELDVDSMVKKGVLETKQQKARLAEIKVLEHFKKRPIDLAGENQNSPFDGMCPNGMNYDVKSSGLRGKVCYAFNTGNKYKEEIELYYFLAFNKDYTKLDYGWRVPGEMVESSMFYVGLNYNYEFNIGNMEEYDITAKLRDVLGKC